MGYTGSRQPVRRVAAMKVVAGTCIAALWGATLFAQTDPRDDACPWGIGSGAEWSGEYPRFTPMLKAAGARWLRLFPEWQSIQPKQGQWRWDGPDALVAQARANDLRVVGVWCYFAPWASADGGTRKGPIKDLQYWRDYVTETVKRYQKDIWYWEVWNEFNFRFDANGSPSEFLIREVRVTKASSPSR